MLPPVNRLRALRRQPFRVLLHRTMAAAMALIYVVVAAGVPLPSASRPAKSGERYPCEACGCGCDSAEHCWRNCCCHTLAERLAWATKNGVKPPDFALAAARAAGLDSAGRPLAKVVCAAAQTKSCCREKQACCSSHETKSCCAALARSQRHFEKKADVVVAWRALACHGQSFGWLAAVPTLVSIELTTSDELPLVAWLGPQLSESASPHTDAPTPPPPERA